MAKDPQLTPGEKAKVAWLIGRMCKRGLAGENVHQADLQKKLDRILEAARQREAQAAKQRR